MHQPILKYIQAKSQNLYRKKLKTVQNKKVMLILTLINLLSSTAIGCI